jgi:hypothetical protein
LGLRRSASLRYATLRSADPLARGFHPLVKLRCRAPPPAGPLDKSQG